MAGAGVLRVALAIASLLLATAAGAHFGLLHASAWAHRAELLAHRIEAAAWRSSLPTAARIPAGDLPAATAAALAPARGHHSKSFDITSDTSDHTLLGSVDQQALEELIQKLLSVQTGAGLPTGIEIIAVERVTVERSSTRLRSMLGALLRVLREPAAPKRPAVSRLPDAEPGAMPSAANKGGAGAEPQGAQEEEEEEQRLPVSAFDDAYVDDVDEMEQPGRRLLQEQALKAAAAAAAAEPEWQAVKLFGPRVPALQQMQPVLPASGAEVLAQEAPEQAQEPTVNVRVIILVRDQPSGSAASSLLDSLALPPREARTSEHELALQLGRHAGAGLANGVPVLALSRRATRLQLHAALGESAARQLEALQAGRLAQSRSHMLLLAAVDSVFVAALVIALVCCVLLVCDIVRHGWRQPADDSGTDNAQWGREQLLRAPLLVVAADEAAAWEAACKQ